MTTGNNTVEVEGRRLTLSNLNKILWPQAGFSKADLVAYYLAVSPVLLPHLKERPLVITRFPNGVAEKSFYQKNAPEHLPDWIPTCTDSNTRYMMVSEAAALVWLANQAAIELHPWLSSQNSLDCPDFLVIDLDPSPANTYAQVVEVALAFKALLEQFQLHGFPKTSGGDGLHIYVPLRPIYSYQVVRELGHIMAAMVATLFPDITTIERSVKKRGDKIYLDYMQNVRGKTLCAPYSVRPRQQATVSTPLRWEEIHAAQPEHFDLLTVPRRIKTTGDLFAEVLTRQQSLEEVLLQLGKKELLEAGTLK
ncbi:MAG: non-homologous end-joining DNA ligase [Syntrophomonadaceae bacterium]|jgi:bifunctional non-homologous end joining protein LigD